MANKDFVIRHGIIANTNLIYAVGGSGKVGINTITPNSTLEVNGTANVSGNVSITGVITAANSVNFNGNVNISNSINITGSLGVNGATTLNTLSVSNAVSFSNTFTVNGAVTFNNILNVVSSANLQSNVAITRGAALSNTLSVTGAATFSNSMAITGATTIGSTLNVTGATVLSNTLSVTGFSAHTDSSFNAISANGYLHVNANNTQYNVFIDGNRIQTGQNHNGLAELAINYAGYLNGVTQFRDTTIFDGKGAVSAKFVASNKTLYSYGDVVAFTGSDISLKENITPITNALEKVSKINGVEFDWKDEYLEHSGDQIGYLVRKHDVGVIAQEIEAVLPEVVATRETGIKAVKYDRIVALLIEAIKELNKEIQELKSTK